MNICMMYYPKKKKKEEEEEEEEEEKEDCSRYNANNYSFVHMLLSLSLR